LLSLTFLGMCSKNFAHLIPDCGCSPRCAAHLPLFLIYRAQLRRPYL
jgi:hypothetical protein